MRKLLAIFMIFTVMFTFTLSPAVVAAVIPRLGIASPSSGTVEVGGTIRYTVNIYNADKVNLNASHIRISGVSANISVEGSGNTQRVIVLSNIQGSVGASGYISYIAGGVATNADGGSREMNLTSTSFTVVATVNRDPQPKPPVPSDNNNNNNPDTLAPNVNPQPNNNPDNNQPQEEPDNVNPTMQIGNLTKDRMEVGDEISFDIVYNDDKEMGDITLNQNDITLYGFKANIAISGEGNTRKVTLTNIQGNLGGLKYIKVASNTAKDKAGNSVQEGGDTSIFKIINSDTKNKPDDWIDNPNTGK